ncbi:MAG TPA: hypothetical protein VFP84_21475 [Kofleriaceae bacterium]|nr:hypothetical protein [Kofleriaceae bacterium]
MKAVFASFLALPVALSLVACVQQDDSPKDLAKALPTPDQVAIKLPDTQRLTDSRTSAVTATSPHVLGQIAPWYVATRDVSRTFNGGSAFVLGLVHAIVQFPVTSVDGNVFTWGPWSDGALAPAEYKLDVEAVGDGTYKYQLSGRSKVGTAAGGDFQVVIDGSADPRNGDAKGTGSFSIDFDASKRINPTDNSDAKGSVRANYDLAHKHLDLTLASTDAAGAPVTGDYAYDEAADGGGQMVFALSGNAGGGPANETISLRSRWESDGAGRADARIAGGDLGGLSATASECWDDHFLQVFYIDAISNGGTLSASEGQEAACAIADADLPDAP